MRPIKDGSVEPFPAFKAICSPDFGPKVGAMGLPMSSGRAGWALCPQRVKSHRQTATSNGCYRGVPHSVNVGLIDMQGESRLSEWRQTPRPPPHPDIIVFLADELLISTKET